MYIAGLQKQFPVCSCMGDSGRELHPGDKQLAAGVEEVQIVAAEIAGSVTKDPTKDNAEVGRVSRVRKFKLLACHSYSNDMKALLIYLILIPAGFLSPVLFLCFSF